MQPGMTVVLKRVELHDGGQALINPAQVVWLEARDPRTTRIHFAGSSSVHVKGSIAEIARLFTSTL